MSAARHRAGKSSGAVDRNYLVFKVHVQITDAARVSQGIERSVYFIERLRYASLYQSST